MSWANKNNTSWNTENNGLYATKNSVDWLLSAAVSFFTKELDAWNNKISGVFSDIGRPPIWDSLFFIWDSMQINWDQTESIDKINVWRESNINNWYMEA